MNGVIANPPPATTPPGEEAPDPPRFRVLRRASMAGLLLLFFLVGLYFAWSWDTRRRIDAIIAAAHAGRADPARGFQAKGHPAGTERGGAVENGI